MELANFTGTSPITVSARLGVPARHETQPPKKRGQYEHVLSMQGMDSNIERDVIRCNNSMEV